MTKLPNDVDHAFDRIDLMHLGAIREDLTSILRHLECLSPAAHGAVLAAIPSEMLDQENLVKQRDTVKALVALGWADYKTCCACGYKIAPGEDHGWNADQQPLCLLCGLKFS